MKHTKEPWRWGYDADETLFVFAELQEVACIRQEQPDQANAQRICDCVNACAGLNPKAVPKLLEACKAMVEYISQQWEDDWENRPNHLRLGEEAIAANTLDNGKQGS